MAPPASPQQHLQQLGCLLDLGQAAMVGALGALVSVLRRVSAIAMRCVCASASCIVTVGWVDVQPLDLGHMPALAVLHGAGVPSASVLQ